MSAVKETIIVLNGGEFFKRQMIFRALGIVSWVITIQFLFPSTPEYIKAHTLYYWGLTTALGYAFYRLTTHRYLFLLAQQKQINEQIKSYLGLQTDEKKEDYEKLGELAVQLQMEKKLNLAKAGASALFSIDMDAKGNKILKIVE